MVNKIYCYFIILMQIATNYNVKRCKVLGDGTHNMFYFILWQATVNIKFHHRSLINLDIFAARCFGLWNPFGYTSTIAKVVYIVYNVIMTSTLWICAGTLIAHIVSNFDSLIIDAEAICFLAGITPIIFKHVAFLMHRKRIIKLVKDIFEPLDDLVRCTDKGTRKLLKTKNLTLQIIVYSFWTLGISMIIGILTAPSINGSLPITANYLFDTTDGLKRNIAFTIQAMGISNAIIGILFMDGIIMSSCFYTIVQLQLLNSNYRHCQLIWPTATFWRKIENVNNCNTDIHSFIPFSPKEVHEANESFKKRFIMCIKHHHRIFKIIEDINNIYGGCLFVQLLAGCIVICFTGFQIALATDGITILFKYIIFYMIAFAQQFAWCWIGNGMLNESFELANSAWLSQWENEKYSDISYLMIVSMHRGQKIMTLKAFNFYVISMQTFVKILRASYSLFAVLRALTKD